MVPPWWSACCADPGPRASLSLCTSDARPSDLFAKDQSCKCDALQAGGDESWEHGQKTMLQNRTPPNCHVLKVRIFDSGFDLSGYR